MKYTGTLIAVKDMEKSRQFYHDVLGLEVATDFGANVTLTGGLVLQTLETWQSFIHTSDVTLKSNAGAGYFGKPVNIICLDAEFILNVLTHFFCPSFCAEDACFELDFVAQTSFVYVLCKICGIRRCAAKNGSTEVGHELNLPVCIAR